MVVAVCAVGVAVATLAFAALSAVLLRPLPYGEPERIVRLVTRGDDSVGNRPVSLPLAQAMAARVPQLEAVAVADEWDPTLTHAGRAQYLVGASVSGDFFRVLGVQPALGRLFDARDDVVGHEPVVVVTHGLWQRALGADASAVGSRITLNGIDYTLAGVLPAGWEDPGLVDGVAPPDVFRATPPYFAEASRDGFSFSAVARLRAGTDRVVAQDAVQAAARDEERTHPRDYADRVAMALVPLVDAIAGSAGDALRYGLLAALAVWLIALANASNLLLLSALERRRRLALCRALGASDARLFRELLARQTTLAMLGGALGLALAAVAVAWLRASPMVALVPRLDAIAIAPATAAFALALSALLGAASAVAASASSMRTPPSVFVAQARGAAGERVRGRRAIVVVQLALATLLVSVALLSWSGSRTLARVELGLRTDDVLAIEARPGAQDWSDDARLVAFWNTLVARLAASGATAVGATSIVPMGQDYSCDEIADPARAVAPGPGACAETRIVAGDYFGAVGQALLQGRAFSDDVDRAGAPPAIILSRGAAAHWWPGGDALGRVVRLHQRDHTVVGIVADVRHFGPGHAAPPMAYLPHAQEPQAKMTLLLRGDAAVLPDAAAVQAHAQSLSGGASVIQSQPLASIAERHSARPRAAAVLLGAFTAAGALLALVGLFSVVDYFAVRRRGEFALRLAVGARSRDLGRLVVGDATRLALLGGGIGTAIALFAAPLLATLVPGAGDAATRVPFLALVAILVAAAAFALAPARRAARTAPATVLSGE
jgi:predicted permease